MSSRRLALATGNPGKVELIRRWLPPSWDLTVLDPGDAEARSTGGYVEMATAKARAVADAASEGVVALGHDVGFEFACLDHRPGVGTKRWLATHARDLPRLLVPGTPVDVVHCLVAVAGTGAAGHVAVRRDERRVRAAPTGGARAGLPLDDWVEGPRRALQEALVAVLAAVEAGTP